MRSLAIVVAAAVLGPLSALLVACGDRNELIPRDDAQAINAALDEASSDVAAEECKRAQRDVARARSRAAQLSPQVDSDLRDNVLEGLANVADQVRANCARKPKTTPTTPTQTAEPEPPPTTETTTPTPTPTQQTTPPTSPPTPTTPPSPPPTPNSGGTPSGDGDGGGASGGGNSGGTG